jgi:hypothetical protein
VRYPPWSEATPGQFQYLHCVRNESGSTRAAPACQTRTIRLAHASGATNAEVVCELCCGSQDPHNAFRRHAGHAGCGSFKASTHKEHEAKYHGAVNCVWNVGEKYVNHMAATEIIMQMAGVLREWINKHARTSRVLGLMIDESTDISTESGGVRHFLYRISRGDLERICSSYRHHRAEAILRSHSDTSAVSATVPSSRA